MCGARAARSKLLAPPLGTGPAIDPAPVVNPFLKGAIASKRALLAQPPPQESELRSSREALQQIQNTVGINLVADWVGSNPMLASHLDVVNAISRSAEAISSGAEAISGSAEAISSGDEAISGSDEAIGGAVEAVGCQWGGRR